jgi:hypothetical protein
MRLPLKLQEHYLCVLICCQFLVAFFLAPPSSHASASFSSTSDFVIECKNNTFRRWVDHGNEISQPWTYNVSYMKEEWWGKDRICKAELQPHGFNEHDDDKIWCPSNHCLYLWDKCESLASEIRHILFPNDYRILLPIDNLNSKQDFKTIVYESTPGGDGGMLRQIADCHIIQK